MMNPEDLTERTLPLRLLPLRLSSKITGNKLQRLGRLMKVGTLAEFYLKLISQWEAPASLVVGGHEPLTSLTVDPRCPRLKHDGDQLMAFDLVSYLPDDILVKVDRAAMSVGLETRMPFLDHRVVEFAWSLPRHLKRRGLQTNGFCGKSYRNTFRPSSDPKWASAHPSISERQLIA